MNPPAPTYQVLTFDEVDTFARLTDLAGPELDERGLSRMWPVLAEVAKSVVVERHYIDKDYRDTFSHYHSKRFTTPSSRCVRLHFFGKAVTAGDIIASDPAALGAYLGYAVIRPTQPNCIGRTFLSHRVRTERNSHLSLCRERVMLMGAELSVEGFPFISQDTDATVCAESSLWMILRYFSNRYSCYPENPALPDHAGGRQP